MSTPLPAPDFVDESFSNLGGANAARRGIRLVADYLSHDPSKDWTAPQILDYHEHGVGVVFLWETTATRALGGYAAGFVDGSDAAGHAAALIAQCGYAPPRPPAIIAAIDFDTTAATVAAVKAYIQGFRAGLAARFLTGAYGEADILDQLGALIDVGFQTYAWSGGRLSAKAALYQYQNGQTIDGAVVDFGRIIDAAGAGAWWPPGLEPAGGGVLEDDMTTADVQAIRNDIAALNTLVQNVLIYQREQRPFRLIKVSDTPTDGHRAGEAHLVALGYDEPLTSTDQIAFVQTYRLAGDLEVFPNGALLDEAIAEFTAVRNPATVDVAALASALAALLPAPGTGAVTFPPYSGTATLVLDLNPGVTP